MRMNSLHRLPDWMGGHEVRYLGTNPDMSPRVWVETVSDPAGVVVGIDQVHLTAITPPVLPEPESGTPVRIGDEGPIFLRWDAVASGCAGDHLRWLRIGHTEKATWQEVFYLALEQTGMPPVVLIPSPDSQGVMPLFLSGLDDERIDVDIEKAPNGEIHARLGLEVELGTETRVDPHHIRVWTYVNAGALADAMLAAETAVRAARVEATS